MDTMSAFVMGQMNRGKELMVFDWDRAAQLILEHKPQSAEAGLSGDWEWTGGEIYRDGEPVLDSYTYLASTWATPQLELDGEQFDCYRMQSETPDWDSETKWPESALKALNGEAA
ncbi:MAG: hypothetical protein PW999_09785 [Paraburkholderia tropica]|nr:hypothetical protein [Paraburkholderia tropica]